MAMRIENNIKDVFFIVVVLENTLISTYKLVKNLK